MNEVQKSNQRYYLAGLEILRATPVISVADFEQEIERRVQPEASDYQPLEGKRRKKWENMADWVKSYLTRRGLIRYATIGDNRYIVFAEPCSSAEGAGNLIPFDTAISLINQLAEVAGVRAEKRNPIRHSAIYTVAIPNCLRILRTDATIYVTEENARQFLDNLDNGEEFELSDGTPTTVVDVPCLVSIELTAEEVQRLKSDIEYELTPPPRNAYCFFRHSSRRNGNKVGNARMVAARDEYIRSHGLTLAELPDVEVSAFKKQPVHPFAALMRVIVDGQIPTGSVLLIDSLRSLRLDSTDGLYGTCRAIDSLLDLGVRVVLLDPLIEVKPNDDFMESVFRKALYSEAARHDSEKKSARAKASWQARKAAKANARSEA